MDYIVILYCTYLSPTIKLFRQTFPMRLKPNINTSFKIVEMRQIFFVPFRSLIASSNKLKRELFFQEIAGLFFLCIANLAYCQSCKKKKLFFMAYLF